MRKASSDKFVAATCRESYYEFFLEFWPLIAAEKLAPNWHLRKLCEQLQVIAERVFKDLPKEYDFLCNCPPGTTKSSIFSVLWQPWIWTRMPSARFISGSYAERLALDLSRKSRDVVTSDKYRRLFPEIALREDQNTKGYIANTRGGMRYATGVGGTVTGLHAHFIVIDDPIDPISVLSELEIGTANIWINETLPDRKVDKSLTPTAMVMQRLHQNDPAGYWIDKAQHGKMRLMWYCLPAELQGDVHPREFAGLYEDGLLDPLRLGTAVLAEAQGRGETYYAGQYLQTPVPRGGALYKVDRLAYERVLPTRWKKGPVRYWDKAATLGGGAYTAGVKLGLDFSDRVWILDVVRGQWDTWGREKIISATAARDGKNIRIGLEQEPGSGGKESAELSMRRLSLEGFRVSLDAVKGDKVTRADGFSQHVNSGGVVLVKAPWNHDYVRELEYFPLGRYKDQADASSGAYALLTKNRIRVGALR